MDNKLTMAKPLDYSINFFNKLTIEPSGDIIHRGKLITSSKEIYTALMEIVTLGYANCPNTKELLEKEREKVARMILGDIEVRQRPIKGNFIGIDSYNYIKDKYIKEEVK